MMQNVQFLLVNQLCIQDIKVKSEDLHFLVLSVTDEFVTQRYNLTSNKLVFLFFFQVKKKKKDSFL